MRFKYSLFSLIKNVFFYVKINVLYGVWVIDFYISWRQTLITKFQNIALRGREWMKRYPCPCLRTSNGRTQLHYLAYNSIYRKLFGYCTFESVTNLQHSLGRHTREELVECRRVGFFKRASSCDGDSLVRALCWLESSTFPSTPTTFFSLFVSFDPRTVF